MQSTIDGDKLALSRQLRTSSYLLAMEWTQAQPTSTQMRKGKRRQKERVSGAVLGSEGNRCTIQGLIGSELGAGV